MLQAVYHVRIMGITMNLHNARAEYRTNSVRVQYEQQSDADLGQRF